MTGLMDFILLRLQLSGRRGITGFAGWVPHNITGGRLEGLWVVPGPSLGWLGVVSRGGVLLARAQVFVLLCSQASLTPLGSNA